MKPINATDEAVQIQWFVRRDMADVLRIDQGCFSDPWLEEDFRFVLRERNTIGYVIKKDGVVRGFVLYKLQVSQLEILRIAVSRDCQRQRIGRQMVLRLIEKLSPERRNCIVVDVHERNLAAQLFLRECGFLFREIKRSRGDDCCYSMSYNL